MGHIFDHAFFNKAYGVSYSELWMRSIKYDEKHIDKQGFKRESKVSSIEFVSPYAKQIAYERYTHGHKHRVLAEDFADSIRLYLESEDDFCRKFHGR